MKWDEIQNYDLIFDEQTRSWYYVTDKRKTVIRVINIIRFNNTTKFNSEFSVEKQKYDKTRFTLDSKVYVRTKKEFFEFIFGG